MSKIQTISREVFDQNVLASKNQSTYQYVQVPYQVVHRVDDTYIVEEESGRLYAMDSDYWLAATAFLKQTQRFEKHNNVVDKAEALKNALAEANSSGVVTINNTKLGEYAASIDATVAGVSSAKPS